MYDGEVLLLFRFGELARIYPFGCGENQVAWIKSAEVNGVLSEVTPIMLDDFPDVLLLVLSDGTKYRDQFHEFCVVEVLPVPALYLDTVVRAGAPEILLEVVNYYGLLDVTAEQSQVFDGLETLLVLAVGLRWGFSDTVLAVEAVTDCASVVDAVHYPVRIVLHGSCEYDYLIEVTQLCQKFVTVWPDHVKEIVFAIL